MPLWWAKPLFPPPKINNALLVRNYWSSNYCEIINVLKYTLCYLGVIGMTWYVRSARFLRLQTGSCSKTLFMMPRSCSIRWSCRKSSPPLTRNL